MQTFNSKRSFTCSNSRHSYLCLLLLLSLKRQFFLTIFYAFDEWVRLKQRYEKNVSITVWWENFEVIHTLLLKIFCTQIFHFRVGKEMIWLKSQIRGKGLLEEWSWCVKMQGQNEMAMLLQGKLAVISFLKFPMFKGSRVQISLLYSLLFKKGSLLQLNQRIVFKYLVFILKCFGVSIVLSNSVLNCKI